MQTRFQDANFTKERWHTSCLALAMKSRSAGLVLLNSMHAKEPSSLQIPSSTQSDMAIQGPTVAASASRSIRASPLLRAHDTLARDQEEARHFRIAQATGLQYIANCMVRARARGLGALRPVTDMSRGDHT